MEVANMPTDGLTSVDVYKAVKQTKETLQRNRDGIDRTYHSVVEEDDPNASLTDFIGASD